MCNFGNEANSVIHCIELVVTSFIVPSRQLTPVEVKNPQHKRKGKGRPSEKSKRVKPSREFDAARKKNNVRNKQASSVDTGCHDQEDAVHQDLADGMLLI